MGLDLLLALGFAVLGLSVILVGATGKAKKEALRMPSNTPQETLPEFQAFRQQTAEEPTNSRPWLQWGHALVLSARKGGSTNLQILRYNEACSCYRQATELSPNLVEAWTSWGATLYELFRLQKGSDIFLAEGGHNKFQAAVDLKPNSAKVWAQWGAELKKVALCLPADNRKSITDLANSCLDKAAELDSSLTDIEEGIALDSMSADVKGKEPARVESNPPLGEEPSCLGQDPPSKS